MPVKQKRGGRNRYIIKPCLRASVAVGTGDLERWGMSKMSFANNATLNIVRQPRRPTQPTNRRAVTERVPR